MSEVEKTHTNLRAFHLAGIIPVGGQPLDFNMPWDDALMPVAPDYLAVERAVYEAACIGCETIWIILHKEAQTLIRHRLGDWIEDPAWSYFSRKSFESNIAGTTKEIPIYYVPIHPKDRDKRDCLSWSVIYGALRAYHISKKISKWVVPDKYYVAFPYGAYSAYELRKKYRKLASAHKNFFVSWNGKTVVDGEYLGFTFGPEEFVRFRRVIREGTGRKTSVGSIEEGFEELPYEERWSARHFTVDKVFASAMMAPYEIGTIDWYYNIGSWDGYCEYLGSKEREWVRKPKTILQYHEFNMIGEDNE